MASLPTRTTASFDAIKPVSSLVLLDNEFNQYVGAAGIFNGGTTGTKLLVKSSDASDPPLEIDQVGAGPLAEWKQNGVLKASIENDGDLLANGVTGAAGVYTFSSIPVGPASNPTTDNQLGRKAYIDGKKSYFTASFQILDPSTVALSDNSIAPIVIVPTGAQNFTITRMNVFYVGGSHTAAGVFTVTLVVNGSLTANTISLDDTNNTALTVYTNNFADVTSATNFWIQATTRSGTVSERGVTITVEGFQTLA